MKSTRLFLALFLILISFSSCEKYLDVQPAYAQDAENYFNSEQDYELALIGAYDLLQASYLTQWIGEIASDNSIAGGESVTDTEGLHEIDQMNHDAVNNELRDIMRFNYAGVARCNYIMEYKDKTSFEGKEVIIGETRFLRAYYYFELVRYFGAMPLIIDKRIGAEEVTTLDRNSASEIYSQIESDLQYAVNNLPWNQPVKGRVDKGAALSLLGKVYLYQNKFGQAATVLDRVVNEGPYSLMGNFEDLWFAANEDNSETVFDVEYSNLEGGSYDCLICLEGNAAAGFNGIRQYEGPYYADGNSYNLPTAKLYNSFDPNDPRRDASVLNLDSFINLQPDPGSISYATGGGGHTGYYNNKYIKRKSELGLPDDDLTSPLNYKVIRYADVLLMAAEAHNRNGNDPQALIYVNEVRNRVGLGPLSSGGNTLTQEIWQERNFELAGEGHRFFDLVRTGQAANEIDGFVSGKHEVFPIPQVEIDLSGGNWNQNPGY
ncbi:RagB/SusD family nutrient uptake outer membrane protein [Croceimicrobium sp.]|uniref:RagB/SusD family nutrient uptake outer membrane protein n=1 Tax=Croceimicrobium sp. TaxID=2828340 RepID=UPI003BAB0629